MKISYDKKADAFSLMLKKGRISRDMEVAEGVFAGFDRQGNLIEIQILDVSKLENPWLTLGAASKYLDVSQRTLLRWIQKGKLKPGKVGKEYRIKPEDLKKIAS
ncbi:MAG: helix-turn-helix domain-containing protein [Deltaproteobacteria bacterium]|nr:helix-turn-helix domain-containing protein [Deltaproteobacteria bacterium]